MSSTSLAFVCLAAVVAVAYGQRITTIQLDGVQYFISRMNPYSPELNYFLAYQYCRSIGLQLASFETKEKADSIMQYLGNAGYDKYDFWTSGNRLGTDMLIWMSTGLPFNATFDYMRPRPDADLSNEQPAARQLSAVEQKTESGAHDGCVAMTAPDLTWATHDCTRQKDFVCEQTRCYYYNYGSIPVSSAQGSKPKTAPATYPATTTTHTTATVTTVSYQENSGDNDYSTQVAPQAHYQEHQEDTTAAAADTTEVATQLYDTTEPVNIRAQKSQTLESTEFGARTIGSSSSFKPINENDNESPANNDVPWPWARNIMLEKPKKKNTA